MKPITVVMLFAIIFAGSFVAYRKYEEHTKPKPPEPEPEAFAAAHQSLARAQREARGFRAEEAIQQERRKQLDDWVNSGVVSFFGSPGGPSTTKMTVAPGFFVLNFQDKQTVAITAFRYLHKIADGTPAEHLKYDRLILVDNLNNHEVGSVALDPSSSSTMLTMNR